MRQKPLPTRPVQRILFPTDFSEVAQQVWPHALELATRYHASLDLLHVSTSAPDHAVAPQEETLDHPKHEGYIQDRLREFLGTLAAGHQVQTIHLRAQSPAPAIIDYVERNRIDLTVIGTRGRSRLEHFLLGSVAEKVVRHAPCPVLSVGSDRPDYTSHPQYRNILAAFDFSEYSRDAVYQALDLAERFQSQLHVLYVIAHSVHPTFYESWRRSIFREVPEITQRARQAFTEAFEPEAALRANLHIEPSDERDDRVITQFARDTGMDLIVMGSHGLSGWERALMGSTTERVVRTAQCPVLTVKPRVREGERTSTARPD